MAKERKKDQPVKEPIAESSAPEPAEPTPMQRPAFPEEQVQVQLAQQRGRAEVAVLKQRFAETDVAMTIAQAECDQLVRQNQSLQQENARLTEELANLTKDENVKEDNPSTKSDEEQTAAPESEA